MLLCLSKAGMMINFSSFEYDEIGLMHGEAFGLKDL